MPATHVVALDFTFGDYQAVLAEMVPAGIDLSLVNSDSPDLASTLARAEALLQPFGVQHHSGGVAAICWLAKGGKVVRPNQQVGRLL